MGLKSASEPFTLQFSSVDSIDADNGKLMGVTVCEVGVATGHFCFVDRENKIMGVGGYDDMPEGAARRLPLCADDKTLLSVVAAAGNKRVKTREDHDDSIAARAGYSSNFRIVGDKVVCDLSIFDAYANRALFVETAQNTPELIGLSGDFRFEAEVIGDGAFMRVGRIDAVDIVDKGALTHAGLFKAKQPKEVDTPPKDTGQKPHYPPSTMSKAAVPDSEIPDVDTFCKLAEQMATHLKEHGENLAKVHAALAGIPPVPVPTPKDAPAPVTGKGNPDGHVDSPVAAFSAKLTELSAKLEIMEANRAKEIDAAVKAALVEAGKNSAALGIKASAAPAPAADSTKADTKASAEPTEFLPLRDHFMATRKLSASAAARAVMKEKPEVFRQYQIKLGIIKAS